MFLFVNAFLIRLFPKDSTLFPKDSTFNGKIIIIAFHLKEFWNISQTRLNQLIICYFYIMEKQH